MTVNVSKTRHHVESRYHNTLLCVMPREITYRHDTVTAYANVGNKGFRTGSLPNRTAFQYQPE